MLNNTQIFLHKSYRVSWLYSLIFQPTFNSTIYVECFSIPWINAFRCQNASSQGIEKLYINHVVKSWLKKNEYTDVFKFFRMWVNAFAALSVYLYVIWWNPQFNILGFNLHCAKSVLESTPPACQVILIRIEFLNCTTANLTDIPVTRKLMFASPSQNMTLPPVGGMAVLL